jgi:hypothetical protein
MPLTVGRIEAVATSWRACRSRHNLACRLGAFSEETRRLLPQVITTPTMVQGLALAPGRLGKVSNELRRLIACRTNRGGGINIWNAAGLGTDERRNVAVLARLWMRSSLGDVATQFLSAFLQRVEGAENTSPAYSSGSVRRVGGSGVSDCFHVGNWVSRPFLQRGNLCHKPHPPGATIARS